MTATDVLSELATAIFRQRQAEIIQSFLARPSIFALDFSNSVRAAGWSQSVNLTEIRPYPAMKSRYFLTTN